MSNGSLSDVFDHFVGNLTCRHVVFGACDDGDDDGGYVPFLQQTEYCDNEEIAWTR